ncbi:MAG: nicotinate-nucleotide adenylyltransferase [Agitococcus sp.]|nr:nicotinate-nucleotide adenylyltransferase [Agitococcus sp.]
MSKLIAYFGGSFDPIHQGHLATARELVDVFALAKLVFLPTALSPLKQQSLASLHRVAMLKLAIQDDSVFAIDEQELHRPQPSYTIDTLRCLRTQYGTQQSLALIMGMDSFLSLPKWRDWQQLTDFAHLIVVSRPDYDAQFRTELQAWLNNRRCNDRLLLEYQTHGLVYFVATQPHAVSSTDIRARLALGQNTSATLPPRVAAYIQLHHLYGATATNES